VCTLSPPFKQFHNSVTRALCIWSAEPEANRCLAWLHSPTHSDLLQDIPSVWGDGDSPTVQVEAIDMVGDRRLWNQGVKSLQLFLHLRAVEPSHAEGETAPCVDEFPKSRCEHTVPARLVGRSLWRGLPLGFSKTCSVCPPLSRAAQHRTVVLLMSTDSSS
jgi:hypothetical protein